MAKTLCSLSGGRDSSYLLWKVLTETKDKVTAVHFDFSPIDSVFAMREEAESVACAQIVAWLRARIRTFDYRIVPIERFTEDGWHSLELVFYAAPLVNVGEFDRVMGGWTHQDSSPARGGVRERVMEKLFAKLATRGKFEWPLKKMGKAHILQAMPTALEALCMSCENPETANGKVYECGDCRYCLLTEECKARLAKGESAQRITVDTLERKSQQPQPAYTEAFRSRRIWKYLAELGIAVPR